MDDNVMRRYTKVSEVLKLWLNLSQGSSPAFRACTVRPGRGQVEYETTTKERERKNDVCQVVVHPDAPAGLEGGVLGSK